jgi:hypothetical protein
MQMRRAGFIYFVSDLFLLPLSPLIPMLSLFLYIFTKTKILQTSFERHDNTHHFEEWNAPRRRLFDAEIDTITLFHM